MDQDKQEKPVSSGYRIPIRIEALGEREFRQLLLLPRKEAKRKGQDQGLLLIGTQVPMGEEGQRMDLLALDRFGIPWVFEFKRDIARPPAVGQLLTYGSFLTEMPTGGLSKIYDKYTKSAGKRQLSLAQAFENFFDRTLPRRFGQACMVLAAYDFSDACLELMKFLRDFGNIHIGQMKMEWIANPNGLDRREFSYAIYPQVTKSSVSASSFPHGNFYMLAINLREVLWELYMRHGFLLLPDYWGLPEPIEGTMDFDADRAESGSLPIELLAKGARVFLFTNSCTCALSQGEKILYDPDLVPDMEAETIDNEIKYFLAEPPVDLELYDTRGLLGFGVVTSRPVKWSIRELNVFCERHDFSTAKMELMFRGAPWMVRIHWQRKFSADDALAPKECEFAEGIWLDELKTEDQIDYYLQLVDLKDFRDVPF